MSVHITNETSKPNALKLYATKIINVLGGPGSNKMLHVSGIMFHLKLLNKKVEYVPSVAREYQWRNQQDKLRNQYEIAECQASMLAALDGKVEYIITDGSLMQCDFYNWNDKNNIADRIKCSEKIAEYNKLYNNLYVWVDRGEVFEPGRRITDERAKELDKAMLAFYTNKYNLPMTMLTQEPKLIHGFVKSLLNDI